MKKILVVLMMVIFLASGCASFWGKANTATATVADKVCNAPASVIEIADFVINLLKPEVAILVPASAPYVALVTAQGIKDTGCALVTDLNQMIAFIQSANVLQASQAKTAKAINIAPLQVWAGGKALDITPLENWMNKK